MSQSVNFFVAYLAQDLDAATAASVIYLDRITNLNGETITTGDFSTLGRGILTINPDGDGNTTYPESISFTGIDSSGVSATGAVRGLDKDGTTSTTLMRYHPVGTKVILSFGAFQTQDLIDYINTLVVSTRNVIVGGTAGESMVAGDPVYMDDTDNEWKKTDASTSATVENTLTGIAQGTGSDGGNIGTGVLLTGRDETNTGLTVGQKYYFADGGGLSTTPGTVEVTAGYGAFGGFLYFKPRFDQQITEDEQDALSAGGVFGNPSITNKYVTEDKLADTILDEDDFASDSPTKTSSQQSTKAYILSTLSTTESATAAENIALGDAVVLGGINATSTLIDSSGDSGYTESGLTEWLAQPFTTGVNTTHIKYIRLKLEAASTSIGNVVEVSIRADSSGPTGSDIVSVSKTITLFSTAADHNFVFDTPLAVSPSTTYHLVLRDTTVVSYETQWTQHNTTGTTYISTNSGSSWSSTSSNQFNHTIYTLEYKPGQLYKTNATTDNQLANGFIGFATETISADASGVVQIQDIYVTTGLVAGAIYYLSNTPGVISIFPGTQSRRIGKAISTTRLLIQPLDNK